MSYHCNDTRLVPGKAHSIIERDDRGNVIGTYTGYWNPNRRLVTLYPDYRHPALRGSVKLNKRSVYDGMVKCKMQNAECKIKDEPKGYVKSQTSRAMKELNGQEKIKF